MRLARAMGAGHRVIRRRYGQKNARGVVAQCRPAMPLIARVFGPYAPARQTASLSIFSLFFNGLQRFTKLATSSIQNVSVVPRELTIPVGTRVAWVNDGGRHQIVADEGTFTSRLLITAQQ